MQEYRLLQKTRAEERQKQRALIVKPKRFSKTELLQLEFNSLEARKWEDLNLEEQKRYFKLHKKFCKK